VKATLPDEGRRAGTPRTLGDLLYAGAAKRGPAEQEWIALVRSVAAGDARALHALYERAHRLAFTSIVRLTQSRELAEELTVELFHDVWRRAAQFDESSDSALGWIMNLARLWALQRLQSANLEQRTERLQHALASVAAEERAAIEAVYFAESTYVEVAARLQLPLQTVKRRIHEGLGRLCRLLRIADAELLSGEPSCEHAELVSAHALHALPQDELRLVRQHLARCARCQKRMQVLRLGVDWLVCWPTDVLRPWPSLWEQVAQRIALESGAEPFLPAAREWPEPEWTEVASGISCKILAVDARTERVSMLVRLAPRAAYPAHRHAGAEELHLLDGELWIDDTRLFPGDFHYGAPDTVDRRVWSESGCTCVLIASSLDQLD
jgi:DNA-directed RNA polymerase specialized sigma24 family protein